MVPDSLTDIIILATHSSAGIIEQDLLFRELTTRWEETTGTRRRG
jgi:hypothetical protein